MNATMKQVTEVQLGEFTLELDEEKLRQLAEMCESAERTIDILTENTDRLIRLTDHFMGLETESFPLMLALVDIKNDYRMLKDFGVRRKEASHGRD